LLGRESHCGIPSGEQLRRQVARQLDEQVSLGLERRDRHPMFWSPSITDHDLEDWPDRWDLMRRGRPPWEALKGWRPLELLRQVFDALGVFVGVVSLHFAPGTGRPHFHAVLVVPVGVTTEFVDELWSKISGMRETGPLWKRCRVLDTWDKVVRAVAGLRNDLDALRPRLSNDVRYVVNYSMQGCDAPSRGEGGDLDRVPACIPEAVRDRPSSDYVVHATGVTLYDWDSLDLDADLDAALDALVGVDLGKLVTARLESAPPVLISYVSTTCACCDRPLPTVRRAAMPRVENLGLPPKKVRRLRKDRDYCGRAKCRKKASRASRSHRRVLSIIGRVLREPSRPSPTSHPCK